GRERDVRDDSASVCLGGACRQCIEAVLPLATDEVRVDVRAPSRSAVFRYGQHVSAVERVFTRHNPLVFQVRETVEGHNHAKSLIVVALVMRTSNDRRVFEKNADYFMSMASRPPARPSAR